MPHQGIRTRVFSARSVALLTVVVLIASGHPLFAQVSTLENGQAVIVASAHGEVRSVPDRVQLLLSVQTQAVSAGDAASENAERQTKVIQSLRNLGLSSDQISTQDYSVRPQMQDIRSDQVPRIVGYVVTNTIRVQLNRVTMVGTAIDTAIANGANEASSISFYSSNSEQLYQVALASAVANARAEAQAMAVAAGGRLGMLMSVTSGGEGWPSPIPQVSRIASFSAAATPVMPGQETIGASVTAKWSFLPGK
jgi:uncharacterized protein